MKKAIYKNILLWDLWRRELLLSDFSNNEYIVFI